MATVTVDVAGGPMGGAARFRAELHRYLERTGRTDVRLIGAQRRLGPGWLMRREVISPARVRRVALNNVGFVMPGGQRWTLVANALHFLTEAEADCLDRSLLAMAMRQAAVVRFAARRSDVLVVPCTAMAERVAAVLPEVSSRLVIRMHPVSADLVAKLPGDRSILCPVLFEPYKQMIPRLAEWVAAVDGHVDPDVRLIVTASSDEVPRSLASSARIKYVGRLAHASLRRLWAISQAVYFPPGLESFGFPLAEARAYGRPVIARETPQNREIAGSALCGFTVGDVESLRHATEEALATAVSPDPLPFEPDAYFDWMLGPHR